jgi:uncharacterized membrane protein
LVNFGFLVASLKVQFYDSKIQPTRAAEGTGDKILLERHKILSFVLLFLVLGITWASFLLYIYKKLAFFSYVFIVLNGTQVSYEKI